MYIHDEDDGYYDYDDDFDDDYDDYDDEFDDECHLKCGICVGKHTEGSFTVSWRLLEVDDHL